MTDRERRVLRFIERYHAEHDGVSPSFREISAGTQVVAVSGIHRLLTSLEAQGRIQRMPHRQRKITVVAPTVDLSGVPDDVLAREHARRFGPHPHVVVPPVHGAVSITEVQRDHG